MGRGGRAVGKRKGRDVLETVEEGGKKGVNSKQKRAKRLSENRQTEKGKRVKVTKNKENGG